MTSDLIPSVEPDLDRPDLDPGSHRPPRVGSKEWIGNHREQAASVAALAAFGSVFVVYAFWLGSAFIQTSARMFDITSNTPQLILAIGLVVCLSCQQFDLSVASLAAFSATLTVGLYINDGLPMGLAIAIAIAVGAAGGLVNGLLVTRLKLNAFIATLGTGGIYAGLTTVYSKGNVVGPAFGTRKLPHWFSGPGSIGDFQTKVPWIIGFALVVVLVLAALMSFNQRFPGKDGRETVRRVIMALVGAAVVITAWAIGVIRDMNWTVLILGIVALVLWIMLKYTVTGRSIYAVGGSIRAAKFAGIHTDRITVFAFLIVGLAAALAGVVLASEQGSATPGFADPLLLPAYASAFLSTVIISRGRFHIWGTLVGGIAIVYVASGLVDGGVSYTWTQFVNGAILLVAVSVATVFRRTAKD
jgi:ribose/xylose/arabinose/galactoside ABC-type transport system permease subunit